MDSGLRQNDDKTSMTERKEFGERIIVTVQIATNLFENKEKARSVLFAHEHF